MSINTITPKTKEDFRENFRRSDRSQDHGVALRTRGDGIKRLLTEYEREEKRDIAKTRSETRGRIADLALADQLSALTPAELEKEADRILSFADAENADVEEFNEMHNPEATAANVNKETDDEDDAPDERMLATREFNDALRIDRQKRGQHGHNTDPEALYQGRGSGIGVEHVTHITDDEDLSDQHLLDGFSVKDRP